MFSALPSPQRVFQAALLAATGLVILAFLVLLGTRLAVNRQLRPQLEAIASTAAGLDVQIGRVRGAWWSGLTLENVVIHGGPEPTSPVFARVPLVRMDYTLGSFLGARRAIRVALYHPSVAMVLGKNHLFNLQPKLVAPQDQQPVQPVPRVLLEFHNGAIAYTDHSALRPFTANVDHVSGRGTLEGTKLTLDVQGLRATDVLHAHATYDLLHHRGAVQAHGENIALPYWLNRFAYAPQYQAVGGVADFTANLHWQDPMLLDELHLSGRAEMLGGVFRVQNVALPIVGAAGEADFTENLAHIRHVTAQLDGMPLVARGTARTLVAPDPALGQPNPALDLRVEAPAVDIGRLQALFPGLRSLGLAGAGTIDAHVRGTVQAPDVAMRGVILGGRYGAQPVGRGEIFAHYVTGRLDLPRFWLAVADGRLDGAATIGLPLDPEAPVPYEVHGRLTDLDLSQLAAHLPQPPHYAIAGRLQSTFAFRGVGDRGSSTAHFWAHGGAIAGAPLEAFDARYTAHLADWGWPQLTIAWGGTRASAQVQGHGAHFDARLAMPQGDLAALVRLLPKPPTLPVTGRVALVAHVTGDAAPSSWHGEGQVSVADGTIDGQPFNARSALALAGNALRYEHWQASLLGGRLSGEGTLAPFMAAAGQKAVTRLTGDAAGLELWRWQHLPSALAGLTGGVAGHFELALGDDDWTGKASVAARGLSNPHWGYTQAIDAQLAYDGHNLSLAPLVWRQGTNTCRVAGRIALGTTPAFDLDVHGRQLDFSTLLNAVYWPEVLRTLNPRAVPPNAHAPLVPRAALPGASQAPFDLEAALARWRSWRKTPLDRPADAPLVPFWKHASGKLGFDAHLGGTLAAPSVDLSLESGPLGLLERRLDAVKLHLLWQKGQLAVPLCHVFEGGREVLTAHGAMGAGTRRHLSVRLDGLDLGWLDHLLKPRQLKLTGQGNLALDASGAFAAPRVRALAVLSHGQLLSAKLGAVPFDRLSVQARYERGTLAIARAALHDGDHVATLSGRLPLGGGEEALHAPLDLALRLDDDNLAIVNLFSAGRFAWLGGGGRIDLRVGGTPLHPTLGGRVQLHDGTVTAAGLETPVTHFGADVTFNERAIAIKALHGHYGGGDLDVVGTVGWDQFTPQTVDVTAIAQPFRLQLKNNDYQGFVEATLHLQGPVAEPVLSGLVALHDGTLHLRDDKQGPVLPPVRLGDLHVTLGPSLRLQNALMDLSVSTPPETGDVILDGTLAAPRPRGVVSIDNGVIRPLNNPFKVVDGSVEFYGANVQAQGDLIGASAADDTEALANSRLDLTAKTAAYDYDADETVNITAHVTGSLAHMAMNFQSDPIRNEQQIWNILSKKQLLDGTLSGKLDGGQVLVNEVGGLVTSNLDDFVSPYTLSLRRMLHLRTLRFELVTDFQKDPQNSLVGLKPALDMETRPLFDRVSLSSRLVAGEFYDTNPLIYGDNTYLGVHVRFNRNFGMEYRVEPFIDTDNQHALDHVIEFKAQLDY